MAKSMDYITEKIITYPTECYNLLRVRPRQGNLCRRFLLPNYSHNSSESKWFHFY